MASICYNVSSRDLVQKVELDVGDFGYLLEVAINGVTAMAEKRNYRDAGTGKFVDKKYADSHKKTTVSEPKPKNPKK